jgi:hypothetical protein
MAGGGQDGPGLPTSGLIAAAVLLASAIVVHQFPYIVSRPPVSDSAWRPLVVRQDVDARLWQDPFGAVTQHLEQMQSRAPGAEPDPTELIRHDVNRLASELGSTFRETLVLPVMVPGGRHGEDIEGRRRTRYAVVAAMSKLGFTPVDPEHIGFYRSPPSVVGGLELPKIVPWEWFSKRDDFKKPSTPVLKSDPKKVLVLWLDASAFGDTPLAKIERTLSDLCLCPGHSPATTRVVMIGPASSDDLLTLLNEKVPSGPGCLTGMAIYSPWATATWPPDRASVAYLLPAGIRFVRMIGTDEGLMPELGRELAARRVKPPLGRHSIAVVHEVDTSYGRDIVDSVTQRLCHRHKGDLECVYALGYLRGIDGKIPRRSNPKDAPSDAKSTEAKPGPVSSDSLERAEDDSQFDYLRRLAARMRSEHERLVRDGQKGIAAVGVFGSDLYDKLLVLQALRQEFPTAPFFTTDLDARYMHPREFQWTRNLIVASSFGLQLREDIQDGLPPFRNNYQTATFLAVTVAVVNAVPNGQPRPVSDETITGWLKDPGVYEIGRTEALDVSKRWVGWQKVPDGACTLLAGCPSVHPEPVFFDTPYWWRLTAWALGGLFAAILIRLVSSDVRTGVTATAWWVWQHRMRSSLVLGATIMVIALFVLAVFLEGRKGEPFRFFEGISIWPTEILRALAFVVAVIGIIMTEIRRKRTEAALQARYFATIAMPNDHGPRVSVLVREAWAAAVRGLAHPSVLLSLPPGSIAPTWRRVFADKPGRSYFRLREFVDAESLWAEHSYQNTPVARWTRIVVCSILFFLLGLALMGALGLPVTPSRGAVAWWVDRIVIFSAAGALVVLIFCVGDMIRLCDKFAYCLGAPIPNRWPPGARGAFGVKPVDRETPLDAWIDVRFLAEWTGRIGGMIYYPFIVLLLVIVARSSIFDNWDMPPSLVTVVLLSVAMASATVFILRRAAERLRRVSIDRLVTEIVLEEGAAADQAKITQLRTVLDEVRQLGDGAFAPITSQPIVRAALLPLSGAGGIALLEYFFLRR